MACECVSEQESAEAFMAKTATTKTKKASEPGVIDLLTKALQILDKEQAAVDNEDVQMYVNYRQSREKLKALIKFINARI